MPRRPDTPCAGCGKLLWSSGTSLPAGERTCRACRAKTPTAAKAAIACPVCTKDFIPQATSRGTVTQTCSRRCGQLHRPGSAGRQGRHCEVCGRQFAASYGDQRTCGRTCGSQIHGRRVWPTCRIFVGTCAMCAEPFTSRRQRATCTACARRAHDRTYNQRRPRKNPPAAPCIACGTGSFPFPRRRCPACVTERKRQEKRRRAAHKRGALSEPYTLTYVAERDRHRCGLCGDTVSMEHVVPHPQAPTVDHVVPIAEGGDDTRANVQLAHFICNSTKGGSQQLALIG